MIARLILIVLLTVSIFVESTILPFPFVVLFAIAYFLFFEDVVTFLIIFVSSILLDAFLLQNIGHTAVFLFSFFALLLLVEKLFSIKINGWIMAAVILVGVEAYRIYSQYQFFLGVEVIFLFGLFFFVVVQKRIFMKGALYGKKTS